MFCALSGWENTNQEHSMVPISILVAVVVVGIFPFSNRFLGYQGSLQRLLLSVNEKISHILVFLNAYSYSSLNVVMI